MNHHVSYDDCKQSSSLKRAQMMSVGSHFKVRKDNINSLVVEYLDRGFMR